MDLETGRNFESGTIQAQLRKMEGRLVVKSVSLAKTCTFEAC